jgi:hypothetical protein
MYKLFTFNEQVVGVCKVFESSQVCFNFTDPANTDYQQFREEVANGVELQDADGNIMSQRQVDDFLKMIPA